MATYSPLDVGLSNSPEPQVLVDIMWAKKAIGRAAKVLRRLLAIPERVDMLIQHGLLEQKNREDVVKGLQQKIEIEERPSLFGVLLRELHNFSDGADAAKRLQDLYFDDRLNNLRKELNATQTESKPEVIKKDLIKKSLTTFIKRGLDMGIDSHTILMVLESLCTEDVNLFSVYKLCRKEFEDENKPHVPDDQPPKVNEIYFCKEVVQNSIVTCHHLLEHSLECCTRENFLFEENKSIPLLIRLDPEKKAVHQYLIASTKRATNPGDHVIYYIAFGSHQSLRVWKENYTSIEEGLTKQLEQLPIQFILDMLWKGASVVLTGFSFGGSLAQLCAVQLYSLNQSICPELLEKNLLCVTFGQPIISKSLSNIIDGKLDKSRFHAIYITDDIIPRVLRCIDPTINESAVSKSELSERIKSQTNPHEV